MGEVQDQASTDSEYRGIYMNFEDYYKYNTLQQQSSIRLLQVKQHSLEGLARLNCTIEHFDLDSDCPEYDALSYTWGPPLSTVECEAEYGPDNDVVILLQSQRGDGWLMRIGRNLYEALTQLLELQTKQNSCEPDENERVLAQWLWVDAVCINQLDGAEKGHQVAFMNEIYARARTVIAWVGKDDGTFKDVITFHTTCASKMKAWTRNYHEQETRTPARVEQSSYGLLISDLGLDIATWLLRSVALFLTRRRYLSRLWICQELALAKSPYVLLGERMLPLHIFSDCSEFLFVNPSFGIVFKELVWKETGDGNADFTSFARLSFLRWMLYDPQIGQDLFEKVFSRQGDDLEVFCWTLLMILQQCQGHACFDPRDRIYALLSIAKGSVPLDLTTSLVPDYSVTYEDLYRDTASFVLTTLPYLSLLDFVDHQAGSEVVRRPSWIPTFGLHSAGNDRQQPMGFAHIRTPQSRKKMFNASGKFLLHSPIYTFTNAELHLRGKRLGIVSACFSAGANQSEKTVLTRVLMHVDVILFIVESIHKLGPQYWTGQNVSEAIMQALTLDLYDTGAFEEKMRSFKAYIAGSIALFFRIQGRNRDIALEETFINRLDRISQTLEQVVGFEGVPSEDEVTEWYYSYPEQEDNGATFAKYDRETTWFLGEFLFSNATRSMFRTENSFGLGPVAIQSDDQVWALIPGRVVYILRPTGDDDRYLFIGAAYVHGLMFGEAMNGVSETELEDVTLI